MKNLRFDPFKYISFKTLSAGFFGSLVAAWVYSPRLAIGLFFIGALLLLAGEWYAREIYRRPMPETYKSVVAGQLLIIAGFAVVSTLIIVVGASHWLHLPALVWCVILSGGPQVEWQRRKLAEQMERNRRARNVLGNDLPRRNKKATD